MILRCGRKKAKKEHGLLGIGRRNILRSLVGWQSEAYLVQIYAHIYSGVSWPFLWIWR